MRSSPTRTVPRIARLGLVLAMLAGIGCDPDDPFLDDSVEEDFGGKGDGIDTDGAACPDGFHSRQQDPGPRQIDGSGLPAGVHGVAWQRPAVADFRAAYAVGGHEGTDYVNNSGPVAGVDVVAAADGTVVYIRSGCPQSSSISPRNTIARECGAGWGNHVVLAHAQGAVFTRYAHLRPDSITVQIGDEVSRGEPLALMGNTGRSEVRHLHFELGVEPQGFDPCGGNQNFTRIFDVEKLDYSGAALPPRESTEGMVCRTETFQWSNVRSAPGGSIVGVIGDGGFLLVQRWHGDWAEVAGTFLGEDGRSRTAGVEGEPTAFVHDSQFDLTTCQLPPGPPPGFTEACTLHGTGSNIRREPRVAAGNILMLDSDATTYTVLGWDGEWAAIRGSVAGELRSVNLGAPAYVHQSQFVDCEPWR